MTIEPPVDLFGQPIEAQYPMGSEPAPRRGDDARLMRTTWLLSATERLDLPAIGASVRRVAASDSDSLARRVMSRNVFARHAKENSFYVRRARMLSGATVVEVSRAGTLEQILPEARKIAELVERVAVLSSLLGIRRSRTHQLAALTRHRRYGFDLAIAPGFAYVRSSQRDEVLPRGIPVDRTFVRRFDKCGFPQLISAIASKGTLAKRLQQSAGWLFESRLETDQDAAVVKTAISLESLLIASESESLRGPLSERTSFLLSDDPTRRRRIAKSVKAFYDLRSGIVHGGRHGPSVNATLLEGIDRVVLLLLLTFGANAGLWGSFQGVVEEVESRKWGATGHRIQRPFPGSALSRALKLCGAG